MLGLSSLPKIKMKAFSGSHHEIGIQQGEAVRGLLSQLMQVLPELDAFRRMKPMLLPTSLFLSFAKRRAADLLEEDIFQIYPNQAERMRGISEGCGMDLPMLMLLQSMEMLIGKITEAHYRLEACTSLGFEAERTTVGEPIVAKNFDYLNELAPFHLACRTRPSGRFGTMGCTMAPLPGMLDGMNEHGLTVTYNLGYTTDEPEYNAPLSMALQEMLETCRTTQEAVDFITEARQGGHDALLMIADAEGDVRAVELTPRRSSTRRPSEGLIINTNHYHTEKLRRHEIPRNAIWDGDVPEVQVGRRVFESTERRLMRAEELLEGVEKVDEEGIKGILRDHGVEGEPSYTTICVHGEISSSLRSMIFYPRRKRMKLLYGYPCQNEYEEFYFHP
jgi:predicted choloylglycine hydrolase